MRYKRVSLLSAAAGTWKGDAPGYAYRWTYQSYKQGSAYCAGPPPTTPQVCRHTCKCAATPLAPGSPVLCRQAGTTSLPLHDTLKRWVHYHLHFPWNEGPRTRGHTPRKCAGRGGRSPLGNQPALCTTMELTEGIPTDIQWRPRRVRQEPLPLRQTLAREMLYYSTQIISVYTPHSTFKCLSLTLLVDFYDDCSDRSSSGSQWAPYYL